MSGGAGYPDVAAAQWPAQLQAGAAPPEQWLRQQQQQQQQHGGLAPALVPGAGSSGAALLRSMGLGAAAGPFLQQHLMQEQQQQQQQQQPLQHQQQQQPSAALDPATAPRDPATVQAQRAVLLRLRQQIAAAAAKQQLAAQQGQQAQQGGPTPDAPQQQGPQQGQQQPPQQGLQGQQPLAQTAALKLIAQLSGRLDTLRRSQDGPPPRPIIEVDSDLLEKEGERVVSALSGNRAQRAWALNVLLVLSFRQELRLGSTPGLLAALLPVLQEGLAAAVGLSSTAQVAPPSEDDIREQLGLPPLPGWQARRASRLCAQLFPDPQRVVEQLEAAAAAAVVLRNAAEVQQNSALLLDPPVMRCWTWCLNAARELVLQREQAQPEASSGGGGGGGGKVAGGSAAAGSSPPPAGAPTAGDADAGRQAAGAAPAAGEAAADKLTAGAASAAGEAAAAAAAAAAAGAASESGQAGASRPSSSEGLDLQGWEGEDLVIEIGGGPAADICTSLLQMTTVLSSRMLLPAFFECGMLLLRSMLILLRPTWQQCCPTTRSAVLPPPLVSLATLAVAAVATAYQPNTDILLSMTGASGGGQPGITLMQVIADMMICPFQVFRLEAEKAADEGCPGWRGVLPTDAQLLRESRHVLGRGDLEEADRTRKAAELCTLDMLAVLSQLRYLSTQLHLLWRLLTAAEPAGAHARAAAAASPHLLATLCEIAVHRWPQHPLRWHAEGHKLRHGPEGYPAYLRFLSHDMMPAMRERQELLQPLRADAAALLALLSADPATRHSVAFCEQQIVGAVMSGIVPPSEPGVSALLARFAAQHSGSVSGAPGAGSMPAATAGPVPMTAAGPMGGLLQPNGLVQ